MPKSPSQLNREIAAALVTDKQIRSLKAEAQKAGDDYQWLICERAL